MSSQFTLRSASPADIPALFKLIQALAEYENLTHLLTGSADQLNDHLFGPRPYVEAILALSDDQAAGYAVFLHTYSTFLTRPSLYLEDIFVLPAYRQQGIGKALIRHIAQIAVERNCGRLEWSVLDWNTPAIAFYENIGASVLPDWRICRLTGEALQSFGTARGLDRL
jgi:GNAT superfamily N-acetyltransferase